MGLTACHIKSMKEKTTYIVYLINHDVDDVAWTVLDANHRVHAARKAEKVLGRGWEAVTIKPVAL